MVCLYEVHYRPCRSEGLWYCCHSCWLEDCRDRCPSCLAPPALSHPTHQIWQADQPNEYMYRLHTHTLHLTYTTSPHPNALPPSLPNILTVNENSPAESYMPHVCSRDSTWQVLPEFSTYTHTTLILIILVIMVWIGKGSYKCLWSTLWQILASFLFSWLVKIKNKKPMLIKKPIGSIWFIWF